MLTNTNVIAIVITALIVIFLLFVCTLPFTLNHTQKEFYKSLAPLPISDQNYTKLSSELIINKPKNGLNGYQFFDKIFPFEFNKKLSFPAFNEYCLTYNSDPKIQDSCHVQNTNEIILQEDLDSEVNSGIPSFLLTFINKKIGTLNKTNNDNYRILGSYGGNNNQNLLKTTGTNTLPGLLTPTTGISSISVTGEQSNDTQDSLDEGYILTLRDLFIKHINSNTNKYNFIALNPGRSKVIPAGVDIGTVIKTFTIPFFIYDFKQNYTRGIVIVFSVGTEKNPSVTIQNVIETQLTPSKGSMNLEPADLNKTFMDIPILDTNGYFEIQNVLGLFYPFKTSTVGIEQPKDRTKFFQQEAEGPAVSNELYQQTIKDYKASLAI